MQFDYAFKGSSTVDNSRLDRTDMSFAPDLKREPTFFSGELARSIEFREAISSLHDVVVSDLRYKPKDKSDYKTWAAQQEGLNWQEIAARRRDVAERVKVLQDQLTTLWKQHATRMAPYEKAQREYYQYLYKNDIDAWFVLDPVITVHPDEIFFECFSQDEASYGRLGCSYEVFKKIGEFSCGTTNIDYSQALYDEFQKVRTYKTTKLEVDPAGFDVKTTGEDDYREVKIDLPDSWVRGFLQVSSAMSLPATTITLHPMDVHNLCFVLRRHREKLGPRSLRYRLEPGRPVRVIVDPWKTEIVCPRSIYEGNTSHEIRVWGRRRLFILERLIPIAKKFTVHLLGSGLPSFYVADLGHMSFTLGLSGWTANDWAAAGNFDLMAPRADVDELTKRRVFSALRENWQEAPDALARRLGLDRAVVLGALSAYTQAGRAIYDLNKGVYRVRELSREPLPMDKLRFANPREESATRFVVAEKSVRITGTNLDASGTLSLRGQTKDKDKRFESTLRIDADQRIISAECECNFYQQNKLYKGPCEHMLALRMQHQRQAPQAAVSSK